MNDYDIIIVGSGISGSVLAERFSINKKVLVIEKRNHIGGNCYDYIDKDTNIRVNKYGAHLFHTNNERVWNYINKFSEWIPYEHKVIAKVDDKLVPVPININTLNGLYNLDIKNKKEMDDWLNANKIKIENPKNGKELLLSTIGEDLYNKIYKYYTKKQWDKYPEELDTSVIKRVKMKKNFDNRYFTDKYQALPKHGYTKFINNMLNSKNITVLLNTDFFDIRDKISKEQIVFFTGPIDHYFSNAGYPKLEYRSIIFAKELYTNIDYYQSNSVVNYPGESVDFTRIVEYKHFPQEKSVKGTVIFKEYTIDNGEPYYPVPNEKNHKLYDKYKELTKNEHNIYFIGRLASYKYFNMDEAILNALEFSDQLNL